MKKLLILLFSAGIMWSGCGPSKKLTLMVGGASNELEHWQKIVQEFSKKTGIQTELIRQTSDSDQRKQSIMVALRGKKSDPDVMIMDVAWVGQLAHSQWLEPLEPYKEIDKTAFFQSVIELADTYQDQLIALPVYVDGGMLYYRKDLLEKYGFKTPPTSWEMLLTMAVTVQQEERKSNENFWGYVWQGAQYEGLVCSALEWFTSAGGGFLDDNGKSAVNSPANRKALQYMVDLIHKQKVSPPNTYTDMKEEEVRLMFQNGNALFERNWPYAYALHNSEDSAVKGKFDIAPLPAFPGGSSASTLGGWHVGISRFSDQKPEAAQLVEYITSYEVQKELSLKLGWNPGRTAVYDDQDIIKANPHLRNLKAVFENAIPRPSVSYYSELSHIWQNSFNAALSQHLSIDEALTKADKEAGMVIEENVR